MYVCVCACACFKKMTGNTGESCILGWINSGSIILTSIIHRIFLVALKQQQNQQKMFGESGKKKKTEREDKVTNKRHS